MQPRLKLFRSAHLVAKEWAHNRYLNVGRRPKPGDFFFDGTWCESVARDLLKEHGQRRLPSNVATLSSFISRVARKTMLRIAAVPG
jgi:hypothetical protein